MRYLRFHNLFESTDVEQKWRRLTFSVTKTPIHFVRITRRSCVESPPFRFDRGTDNSGSGAGNEEHVGGVGGVLRKFLNAKIDYALRWSKRTCPENLGSHSSRVRTVLEFDGGNTECSN